MHKIKKISFLLVTILYNYLFSMEYHLLELRAAPSDYSYQEPKHITYGQGFYNDVTNDYGKGFYTDPLIESRYTSAHQQFMNNDSFQSSIQQDHEIQQQFDDPVYKYRTLDLDNKEFTQLLQDTEMRRYHTMYLNNQMNDLMFEKKRNEEYHKDDYGGFLGSVNKYLDYPNHELSKRRLSFIKRLLNRHDQKMTTQAYKAQNRVDSPSLHPRSQFKSPSDDNYLDSVPLPIIIDASLQSVQDPHVLYDYKSTFPSSDLFHEKITADPKVDFQRYMVQIEQVVVDLQHAGQYTAETAALFIKGFAEGTAEYCFYIGQHPIEYVQDFVRGNLELAEQVVLFLSDIDNTPEHEYTASYDQMKQYEQRLNQRADAIINTYNKFCETIPHISREDWGRIGSRLFVDYLVCKGVGKGLHGAKNAIAARVIKQKPLLAKICQNIEQTVPTSVEIKDVYEHNFQYHSRIKDRGLIDPIAHNFPYSFDDVILKTKPVVQKDGSLLYRCAGTLNGKNGFFEIAINPTSKIIFHRTFIGAKK